MGQKQFLGNKTTYGGYQFKWKPEKGVTKKGLRNNEKNRGLDSAASYMGKTTGSGKLIYYVVDGYVG